MELSISDLDRIEAAIRYSEDAVIDGLGFGQMIIERADVRALVAALREAWAENREYRRYSMVGKIAIGTGFAPPGAKWLEDEEWTDAQMAEAQAMIDAHPEWLDDDTPDRSAASDEATGGGG